MLELKNIHKNFGHTIALENINLSFEKGKIYLLLGPNGAGKTTLNQIISGIVFPDQGEVFFDGEQLKTSQKIPYSISYLGDTDLFDEKLRVYEFLKLIAQLKSPSLGIDEVEKVLLDFDLNDVKHKKIQNLSLGYRQRVGLAQAFLGKSDILILDEPGSGLDPLQFQELKESIHKIKEDTIVIISTHRIREAKELAESVILLYEGKTLYDGQPKEQLIQSTIHSFTLESSQAKFETFLNEQNLAFYTSQQNSYHFEELEPKDKLKILQFIIDQKLNLLHFEISEQNLETLYFKVLQESSVHPIEQTQAKVES
ncbi:ABC transporter ATP-binding protein [bacterium]|nr:ABC transporter ATP-binding protein [bacterium]